MRLLIHQVLKDLRLLRWLALAWILLVAVLQAITLAMAIVPARPDITSFVVLPSYSAIQALLVGLFAGIAVVVVQSDPAVGTTAFWFTRPISVRVLVASKILVCLILLVVVPIVADLVAMIAGGLSVAAALSTVPGSLAVQLAWLLPLLALAAITTSLAQFVCAVLGELLIFAGSVLAIRALPIRLRSSASGSYAPSTEVPLVVLVLGLVVFAFVALVLAYRTRALRRAATVTGVAPVALALLMFSWNVGFLPWRYERFTSPIGATARFVWLVAEDRDDWSLSAGFRFSNAPPRVALSIVGVRAWIEYPDGRVNLTARPTSFPADPHLPGSAFYALSEAVGTAQLNDPEARPASVGGFEAPVPKDVYARRRYQTGVLHADVRVIVTEKDPAVVAARAGERYRTADRGGDIVGVSAGPEALSIELRDTSVRVLATSPDIWTSETVQYAVRNPRLGVASLPSQSRARANLPLFGAPIPVLAHLSGSWLTLQFPWPDQVSSADFMNGAQLAVVESRSPRYAVVHVTVPDLMLASLRGVMPPMPR